MDDTTKSSINAFKGLNNVADPLRLSLESLVQADNVNISNTNGLLRCKGFTQRSTNVAVTGAYATRDQKRLYVVDGGEIRKMKPDMTYDVVKTGLSAGRLWFEEVNGVVFYSNGVDFGVLESVGWRQWGIAPPPRPVMTATATGGTQVYQVVCTLVDERGLESGSSDVAVATGSGLFSITGIEQRAGYTTNVYATKADGAVFFLMKRGAGPTESYTDPTGVELPYWGNDVPRGTQIAHFGGSLYLAEPYPQYDYTAIWSSLPLQYHHFDYGSDGITVPGTVRMLKGTAKALLIGTDRQIFSFDGERLEELADYGVVAGWHASSFGDEVLFWSLRGLCSVFPFKNLTEDTVSVSSGASAGAMVLEQDGMRRYVVALRKDDSQAYNRR